MAQADILIALDEEGHTMSTNGFISFVANGEAKHAYNHWDSMPDELGVKVLHWLRMAIRDPDALRKTITNLKLVGGTERAYPTESDVARFQVYADRTVGDPATSWYALLRLTQGDPAAILDCGYIVVDYDEPFWWIYEVNSDEQTFSVLLDDDDHAATWPWSALPTDSQFLARANPLGGEWGAAYQIRPASQDARLMIPADTLAEVLTPPGCDARPGPGYGDLHLQGDGFEISFSDEDDGWHVIIEGDLDNLDPDELAAQIARQIAHSTQTATEWLRFIGGAGGWVHVR